MMGFASGKSGRARSREMKLKWLRCTFELRKMEWERETFERWMRIEASSILYDFVERPFNKKFLEKYPEFNEYLDLKGKRRNMYEEELERVFDSVEATWRDNLTEELSALREGFSPPKI